MDDWPQPPANIVLMLYTAIGLLTLTLVSGSYSFQCV